MFKNAEEAKAAWVKDQELLAQHGIIMPDVQAYVFDGASTNWQFAQDALPTPSTVSNAGVPAMLTTLVDPDILRIMFAPNKAAKVLGERKKGTWLDDTVMFPVVEHTGEVSSYNDFSDNGHVGANTNWPQRQQYVYQTVKIYGDREMERAGLARINWVNELNQATAAVMNKFANLVYLFGVSGLQNYGLMNDPNLPAAMTPSTKANGGTRWMTAGGLPNATANEVYADITAMFAKLVEQSNGLIDEDTKLVFIIPPQSAVALKTTNSFGINVKDLLAQNFPGLRIETVPQFATAAGNMAMMIAETVEGQDTGYCSFSEKLREFPVVRGVSHYEQKVMGGAWGAVIRQPFAFSSMLGI